MVSRGNGADEYSAYPGISVAHPSSPIFNAPVEKIVKLEGSQQFHLFILSHNVVVDDVMIATGQRFTHFPLRNCVVFCSEKLIERSFAPTIFHRDGSRRPEVIASIPGIHLLNGLTQVDFNPSYVPATHGQVIAIVGDDDHGLGFAQNLASTAKQFHLLIRSELREVE